MKASKLLFTALIAGSLATFTSCGDDNNPKLPDVTPGVVNPSQVFTNGMPTQVGSMKFTTNSQGQVTQIEENYGTDKTIYTFTYKTTDASTPGRAEAQSPLAKANVVMTISEGTTVTDQFYIFLNEKGYARYAYQVTDDDTEEWWFEYDGAGRLKYMKRSEGDNEVTRIAYNASGDITNVSMRGDGSSDDYTIAYTNETTTTPIDNKGAIMLFDECFGIDMDEFAPAYYAGLLGKATAHLPLGNEEDGETETFSWTLNDNGFPVSLVGRYNGQEGSPIFFNWL